jgi:hypothetical protein
MTGFWSHFALAALVVWRVSHLLAIEDGPFDLVVRLRVRLGDAGRVLDCFYCISVWVAAPMAFYVSPDGQDWWCVWLGLSGAAGLAHRATDRQPADSSKGIDHGMLWTETGRAGEPGDADGAARAIPAEHAPGGLPREPR